MTTPLIEDAQRAARVALSLTEVAKRDAYERYLAAVGDSPEEHHLIGLVQRLDSVLADLRTAADDLAWLVRSGE